MYRVINIGGNDYKLEYSIEASLYADCTESLMGFIANIADGTKDGEKDFKKLISSIANIPLTALTLFYAGLMEHHGVDGDGTVTSISDAKHLIKQYISEHSEDDTGNFYEVISICYKQMENDNFFDLIGLSNMVKKQTPVPQDHKKKAAVKKKEEPTES